MTFTYNAKSPSSRDKVRLLIGDVNENRYVFENEELDTLLELNSSDLLLTAAGACRVIATAASKQAIALSLPGATLTKSQISAAYHAAADKYEEQAKQRAVTGGDFAEVYTSTDQWLDAIIGRGDIEFDLAGTSE